MCPPRAPRSGKPMRCTKRRPPEWSSAAAQCDKSKCRATTCAAHCFAQVPLARMNCESFFSNDTPPIAKHPCHSLAASEQQHQLRTPASVRDCMTEIASRTAFARGLCRSHLSSKLGAQTKTPTVEMLGIMFSIFIRGQRHATLSCRPQKQAKWAQVLLLDPHLKT